MADRANKLSLVTVLVLRLRRHRVDSFAGEVELHYHIERAGE